MDRLSDYDYVLPEHLIAQTPLADRAASRLLHLNRQTGEVSHRRFQDVVEILQPGDLLVMNDTRVTARRLLGHKPTGGEVEALLLAEHGYGEFIALMKPAKRLRVGAEIIFTDGLRATVISEEIGGKRVIRFGETSQLGALIESAGSVPLPPYIHERLADPERYQTVYAHSPGSAAAPTAGLHFTDAVLSALRANGVDTATVTLDVGIDTFRPVMVDDLDLHEMHGETCTVPEETAKKVAACTGRIIAVGTTSVRTLETFADGARTISAGRRTSKLFIRPGFQFQVIDGMFTNFHMPKTTMMMMISALAGRDTVLAAYQSAIHQNYRFLSFGDSMLIV